MKVLLLQPEDTFAAFGSMRDWDVIVDFGRAPAASYEGWRRKANCPVISLYDFAREFEDLHHVKQLLQFGMSQWMDGAGVDWWDVLSLMISEELLQLILVGRLATELGTSCDLYSTRPSLENSALQNLLGGTLTNLGSPLGSLRRRARHYSHVFAQLEVPQLAQIFEDKLDPEHTIRRWLTTRRPACGEPVVLLPSAYVNVSRTGIAYARLLPDQQFLLVRARRIGELGALPANLRVTSLDGYFIARDGREIEFLVQGWKLLKEKLVSAAAEFSIANEVGVLDRIPALLPWGVAARNAWDQVLDSENVIACLCADDSNPYTRIPLILAKKRGLPGLACHHGALDFRMAMKTRYADVYLAKSEMERDYLLRACQVPPEEVVVASPSLEPSLPTPDLPPTERPWLVFFTEPFSSAGWRDQEVYRDLLPRLLSVAESSGVKLVFKLHPFESVKGLRNLLRRLLTSEEMSQILVTKEPMSSERWQKVMFAMTVESSVALECHALAIPVFLCSWLRNPYGAYLRQYATFGIGHVLERPDQVADIPQLLKSVVRHSGDTLGQSLSGEKLRQLLLGVHGTQTASKASL
jgi:hypothetical protein